MNTSPIKVTLGDFTATPQMRILIAQVLDTGRLSYGPLSKRFEQEFAAYHNCAHGVLSNSGTSSLQVALQALKEINGWLDGDEVLVPALTFVATVNVVLHCRLTPVLVDVDRTWYAINPARIEAAVTPRTRCIMPVHPFGLAANMPAIMRIARLCNLKIIEDSCEAMGVDAGGQIVGSWGDVGCFSTYVAHFITGGVGGIGITNDPELASVMRSLVNHGIDLDELPSGQAYDPSWLGRNFCFSRIGHSFRVTEMEAALLLPQLATLPEMIVTRQIIAGLITERLQRHADHLILPTTPPGWEHSYMVYPIVLRQERKAAVMRTLRKNGIECRDMLPLTNQPCYAFSPGFNPFDYPVAQHINQHGFYIGCHQGLTIDHINHLDEVFADIFAG